MSFSEILFGLEYFRYKSVIKQYEYLNEEHHLEYQKAALSELLTCAVKNIPFYRELFGKRGMIFDVNNVMEQLKEFPYITKEIIRNQLPQFHAGHSIRELQVRTGGSSGNTMTFYMDRFVTRQREKAFIWNQWSRVGYRPGDRLANFRGEVPGSGRLYQHDRLLNSYIFSSMDISEARIHDIVAALNDIRPLFFHAYPSTLYQLASVMKRKNLGLAHKPMAALCGSERIFEHQRHLIDEVLNCPVYSWYGHSEYSVLGGECEYSKAYHLIPQYGYVEFLPTEIRNAEGKAVFEIVATGFNNSVMPFIRYKTSDYAVLSDTPCACGRNYPLLEEVIGREQEFLVDIDHELISVTALTALFEKTANIIECMLIQEHPGKADLLIVPDGHLDSSMMSKICSDVLSVTHGRFGIDIQLVDSLPRTSRGKRNYVDQHLNINAIINSI